MCATFGVCFKFLTLLVFEISGTQKSGNYKNEFNLRIQSLSVVYKERPKLFHLFQDIEELHTDKYFLNFIKSNRNQIIFTIFRLIGNQTDVRFVQNQSENGK